MGLATAMNARGLMQLILPNTTVGRALITPTIFAMIVLATPLMGYPLFGRICPEKSDAELRTATLAFEH